MQLEFETNDNKEYKIDSIWDSAIYTLELIGQRPKLYNLIL